jgi:hypothetical protein
MPATINLSTIPGCIERCDSYSMRTMELFGPSLGRETVAVATVADIRAAVQAFGQRVRAVHPDSSFQVSICVRRGDRKPRGYDAAYLNNGFGQEDYLHTVDKRKAAATAEPTNVGAACQAADAAAEIGCEL